ncbi:hypothetical protein OQX63_11765 [Pedobacter sp. PF22-3]|uniref:lipopolysaccharide biosynthesis protein n=1 Tax=Pedobacter sp. PF22-3 TaxID=2994467 RepID=UPI0022468185|nr:hypothetical protein [Pedobacter sp. PF22-3]MCX2494153.1 hypothetical protein [Pedobacter sp. PF22-3]
MAIKLLVSGGKNLINKFGDRTKSVIYGSGLMVLSTFVNTLTRVGLIAILARIYTKDEFGIWVAITSATAVMATSDFGIGNALRNKLAELRPKGAYGDEEGRSFFFSVLYFFIIIACLISIILFLFKDQIGYSSVFNTSNTSLKNQGVNILLGVQTIFLFGIPFGIGASMFFAYQESFWVAIQNILNGILSLIIVSLLAFFDADITITALTFFIITFLINCVGTLVFIKKRKWGMMSFKFLEILRKVKKLLFLSLTFAILQISGAFIYNATTLIATANLSLSNGAELNLVQKLYTFIITVFLSFYNPVWAGYADAINRLDWLWCRKTLNRTLQLTSLLFLTAIFIFAYKGNFFLQVLAGKSYVSNIWLFISLGLWAMFYALYSMGVAFLSATGKVLTITIATGVFALSYVHLGNILSLKYGLNGIAILSAAAFFILTLITYLQSFLIIRKNIKKI